MLSHETHAVPNAGTQPPYWPASSAAGIQLLLEDLLDVRCQVSQMARTSHQR
jgi:hypothetical protein